jgi:malate synthase
LAQVDESTLTAKFERRERLSIKLNGDQTYQAPGGGELQLPGRSLMLVRHVGLHMFTDGVLDEVGEDVPGILDATITALIATHEIRDPVEASTAATVRSRRQAETA